MFRIFYYHKKQFNFGVGEKHKKNRLTQEVRCVYLPVAIFYELNLLIKSVYLKHLKKTSHESIIRDSFKI